MTLIKDNLGPDTSASAILYRDAGVYTRSLAAGTIIETLEEDGILLQKRRDLAAFRALYAGRTNDLIKALNAPSGQAQQKGLFSLISHRLEYLVV